MGHYEDTITNTYMYIVEQGLVDQYNRQVQRLQESPEYKNADFITIIKKASDSVIREYQEANFNKV